MFFKTLTLSLVLVLAFQGLYGSAKARSCDLTNEALKSMSAVIITFHPQDGESWSIDAKLADTNSTRAAGFQNVCESVMKETPILFVFNRAFVPEFHMNNVIAPIDIAFIKANGQIDSIQAMLPYVLGSRNRPLYSAKGPVLAALETSKDFYRDNNIDQATKISWRKN